MGSTSRAALLANFGLGLAATVGVLPVNVNAAMMPICNDEPGATKDVPCRRPYKFTNMGGRGGDINAPNKYASGRGGSPAKESKLKEKIATAKAQQEALRARYNPS